MGSIALSHWRSVSQPTALGGSLMSRPVRVAAIRTCNNIAASRGMRARDFLVEIFQDVLSGIERRIRAVES